MIFDRIQSTAEELTPSEHKLVKELLARPRDAALGTAGALARRIGVHEATASRLARKLGYESYADFRDALRQEFIVKTDPAQETAALSALQSFLTSEALTAAAGALLNARKVFIFARGNAEALSVLADRRLRRMGVDTTVLSGDARDLAERLAAMEETDALLAFAFRRAPRHWGIVLDHAAALGAPRIVISDTLGPALVPNGDHLLFAPRSGSEEAFQTLTVPMTIANALILQMAQLDEHRSIEHLERVGQLLAVFDGS